MEENNAATEQPSGPQFAIQRTFIKDLSFETPMGLKFSPKLFNQSENGCEHAGNSIAEGVHEIVLTLTITAKVEEDTAYIVELQQAGIFAINGFVKSKWLMY